MPPPTSTINGEHLGYRIAYRVHRGPGRSGKNPEVQEININDPDTTSHDIQNLVPFSKYLMSVQVVNPEGLGPAATVEVSTDEGGNTKHFLVFFVFGLGFLAKDARPSGLWNGRNN